MIDARFVVLVLGVVLSRPAARGQTLSEALDTPDRTWTPAGAVTALNDPALAHDGVDAVRLDLFHSPETATFESSITTEFAVPSVVEFWHRSQDLDGVTVLGINRAIAKRSSVWRREQTVVSAGALRIANLGGSEGGPLYLDSLKARPAVLTGLAEALDWPGTVDAWERSNSAVLGLAEAWLAPDGVDAVYFNSPEGGIDVEIPVSGPALLSYQSRDARDNSGMEPVTVAENSLLPEFTAGDRTWFQSPATGRVRFRPRWRGDAPPIVMDMLEALDAPGLDLTLSGAAFGTSRVPAGSSDGDAVVCMAQQSWPLGGGSRDGQLSLRVSGPAVVRFEWLGYGSCAVRGGLTPLESSIWRTGELQVYGAAEIITWQGGLCLNAVRVQSLSADRSPGGLLDAPGLAPEFPIPVYLEPAPGGAEGDEALSIRPASPEGSADPLIRLPFQGPSVVSVWVSADTPSARVRVDGGPWQAAPPANMAPGRIFAAVAPGEGTHFLEVTGPAVLDRFQAVPLEELPLAEALNAPGMVFTTSPGTPWKGYKVPEGMGLKGGHGATGGQHAEASDPWIETRVEGPGILEFGDRACSLGSGHAPENVWGFFTTVLVDGVSPPVTGSLNDALPGILLGPGPHTVRWIQKGSRARDPLATTLWLDGVSFMRETIPLSEALDTPGRGWTSRGALPVAWAAGSPDGVDSVQLPSAGAWVGTVVNLPARVTFTGKNLRVTDGTGRVIVHQEPAAAATFQQALSGTGPARLRFGPSGDGPAVLDQVTIFESTDRISPAAALPPSGIGWRSVDGKPWSVLGNPVTGETLYGAENPVWMEAVVTGPCVVTPSQDMTLPEHGNRKVFDGKIHYHGPQRVLMARRGGGGVSPVSLFDSGSVRPALSPAEAMKVPGMVWSSGGEAPWMGVAAGEAISAPVWPGEVSWIEAELTGPGVLVWGLFSGGNSDSTLTYDVLCDGVALLEPRAMPARSPSTALYLHLSAGPHRVRWQASQPLGGTRNSGNFLGLREVDFTPQPTGSVTGILGSHLNFLETAPHGPEFPLLPEGPWPAAGGWRPGMEPVSGASILEARSGAGSLGALLPAPGTLISRLKMERMGLPLSPLATPVILPEAAAPFPWTTWTARAPLWPSTSSYLTSAAGVEFVPHTPVSVGEALDQPGLEWTTGGSPGLWRALTGIPGARGGDPDALYLTGMAMGDTAWLETTVTGPLNVSTQFEESSVGTAAGLRILLNGVPVRDRSRVGAPVRVPAGTHRLRWEAAPVLPMPVGKYIIISGVTLGPGTPMPDVNALLDAPDLKWGFSGTRFLALSGASAHDGVDALSLGGSGDELTMALEGPGLLSFWMWTNASFPEPLLDGLRVPLPAPDPPNPQAIWRKIILPIPAGPHICQFRTPVVLDEFDWRPLPALTPEETLDVPAGVTVTMPDPTLYGAAAWPEFSDDGTDSLMIMPGQARRPEVKVPPLSTLSARVRTAFGTGAFSFQEAGGPVISTSWTTVTVSTQADAGLTTVYLTAHGVPVLVDRLTVTSAPAAGAGYFPWADSHGLTAARNQPLDDPDGDGWSNLLEYSLGQDPMAVDRAQAGTEILPGLPGTTVWTDPATGLTHPEIRYWRRNGQSATVETAQDPQSTWLLGDPAGWTPSPLPGTVTTPGPEGWSRVVWRAAEPVAAGGRVFVRVRYSPF